MSLAFRFYEVASLRGRKLDCDGPEVERIVGPPSRDRFEDDFRGRDGMLEIIPGLIPEPE